MLKGKMVIGQSGGPTVVINQSLVGAILAGANKMRLQEYLALIMVLQVL